MILRIKIQVYWCCIVENKVILSVRLCRNVQVYVSGTRGRCPTWLLYMHDVINNICLKSLTWMVGRCPISLMMIC